MAERKPPPPRSVATDDLHFADCLVGRAGGCLSHEIHLGMASAIGEEFFCFLVRHLVRAVQADYGFISEYVDDEVGLRTVAAYGAGGLAANFTYHAAVAPCGDVLRMGTPVLCSGPQERFRTYPLIKGKVDRYLGIPIVDYAGQTIGTVALLWETPGADTSQVESLLNVFSLRIAAELERERSIRALERQLHFLQVLVDAIPNPIFYKDSHYRYLGCNAEFENFFGIPRQELIGKSVFDIVGPDLARHYHEKDLEASRDAEIQMYESVVARADNVRREVIFRKACFTAPDGTNGGIVGSVVDVTEHRRAEQTIHHLANYDPLTGLPNRTRFRALLAGRMEAAEKEKHSLALLLLDMDYLKKINESWGHSVCNQMLQMVGARLSQWSREGDLLGRIGGDKFGIVISRISCNDDAAVVSKRLLEMMSRPFQVMEQEIHCSCSIGVALFPGDGENADTLLKKADTAIYQAKQNGRARFQFYSEDMDKNARERLTLESGLRSAIRRGEFILLYQPQIELQTRQIVGVEALLRWQHPVRGRISPDAFIPLAEKTSLIVPLGKWVLHAACAQNKAWQDAGHPPVRVAVNISPLQLEEEDFIQVLEKTLQDTGLDPDWLELELTETAMMQNTQRTLRLLKGLKDMGVHLSIDDFGTGYSSLEYLKRFPVDKLKLDRSYVCGIPQEPHDVAIAEAILAMAGGLGLKVLAEGVETAEQVHFLEARGCDISQGYYFGHPMSPETLVKYFAPAERRDTISSRVDRSGERHKRSQRSETARSHRETSGK